MVLLDLLILLWWIHRDEDEGLDQHASDHMRNWKPGIIADMSEDSFTVMPQIMSSSQRSSGRSAEPIVFPLGQRAMPSDALLAIASVNERCIDWKTITKELMTGKICGTTGGLPPDLFHLSRPVKKIDVYAVPYSR